MPWREPQIIHGAVRLRELPNHLKTHGIDNVLLVTDAFLAQTEHFQNIKKYLKDANIKYSIYDQTIPNPTIGNSNFGGSAEAAIIAGRLIIENIQTAYRDGQNIKARENLQKASYLAGSAFTRAYVGYVHSIAHSPGGMYHTPHGLANAIILPHVLDYYGEACEKRLGFFAKAIGAVPAELDNHEASKLFIMQIRELNRAMGNPEHLDEIQNEDIPTLAKSASKEANPLYPVPKILNAKELETLYRIVKGTKL